MYEEDELQLGDIVLGTGALGLAGTATGAGIIAERARRRTNSEGGSYRDNIQKVGRDMGSDLSSAFKVIRGDTPHDLNNNAQGVDPVAKPGYSTIRQFSQSPSTDYAYSTNPSPNGKYVSNPITQAAISARDAFSASSEDLLGFKREERLERGVSPEGPKSDTVMSRIPLFDGVRDVMPEGLGGFNQTERQHRAQAGIDLMKGNSAQAAGGLLGRTASDFVNNGARSLWWLLNAPQAVVDVASEMTAGMANREGLYGLDYVMEDEAIRRGWLDSEFNPTSSSVNSVKYDVASPNKNDPQLRRRVQQLIDSGQTGDRVYSRRRVGNNLSTLLALPAAISINSGLGLNSLNGSDGREAVFASEADPTKTDNAIAEVAAKYILGRQGKLLPWDEYKEVRPDVSKDDYMRYKAYKFDKTADYNIFDDGKINILNGVVKTNDDGIDGGEVMFLGRSMPVATTIMPTVAGIGGAALGAGLSRYGGLNIDGVKEGIETRKTQLETLSRDIDGLTRSGNDPSQLDLKSKQFEKIGGDIEGKRRLLNQMQTGPMSPMFNRMRKTNVIVGGLAAGAIAGGLTQLTANLIENRRREDKARELGSK